MKIFYNISGSTFYFLLSRFFIPFCILLSTFYFLDSSVVFASATDGIIDSTNKYAWSENAGWINFGSTEGNVHIIDSALTGYAWAENIGWISLNCSNTSSCATVDYKISNNNEGTLTGYAWSENTGWLNFNPTYGGVTINSSGEFLGYAWGENIGWVVFNCATTNTCATIDYKVSTDWRPQSTRTPNAPTLLSPADDGSTADLRPPLTATFSNPSGESGSLRFQLATDSAFSQIIATSTSSGVSNNSNVSWTVSSSLSIGTYYWRVQAENNSGATSTWSGRTFRIAVTGGSGSVSIIPSSPQVIINNNAISTTDREVSLTLSVIDGREMFISNNADFSGAQWEPLASSKSWLLTEGNGAKTIYVKFRSISGNESVIASNTILLNTPSISTSTVPVSTTSTVPAGATSTIPVQPIIQPPTVPPSAAAPVSPPSSPTVLQIRQTLQSLIAQLQTLIVQAQNLGVKISPSATAVIQSVSQQLASLPPAPISPPASYQGIPVNYQFPNELGPRLKNNPAEVRYLQIFLKAQGEDIEPEGAIDGYYGSATTKAVRNFQEKHGIKAVGRVGPQTKAKINEILKNINP